MFVLYVVMTGYNIQAIPGLAPSSSAQYQQVQELQQHLRLQQEQELVRQLQYLQQQQEYLQQQLQQHGGNAHAPQLQRHSFVLPVETVGSPAARGSAPGQRYEFVTARPVSASSELFPKIHPEGCVTLA